LSGFGSVGIADWLCNWSATAGSLTNRDREQRKGCVSRRRARKKREVTSGNASRPAGPALALQDISRKVPMDYREKLTAEHRHIEELLEQTKSAVQVDHPRALCEAWTSFERELTEHMRFEEEVLLPRFAEVDPAEAHALRVEHDELRRLIGELGIRTDLHALRADVADELFARLRAHAQREDASLYPWAAQYLAEADVRAELSRLFGEVRLKLHLLGMDAKDAYRSLWLEGEKLGHKTAHASREGYERLLTRLRSIAGSIANPRD
jgi:hemerythrin-like domain-containing protein